MADGASAGAGRLGMSGAGWGLAEACWGFRGLTEAYWGFRGLAGACWGLGVGGARARVVGLCEHCAR